MNHSVIELLGNRTAGISSRSQNHVPSGGGNIGRTCSGNRSTNFLGAVENKLTIRISGTGFASEDTYLDIPTKIHSTKSLFSASVKVVSTILTMAN